MKSGVLLSPTQTLPERLQQAIHKRFPGKGIQDLSIRYYESVEDVGYEFYMETVLPPCPDARPAHYLAPFISFVRLGEALILDRNDGLLVYETDQDDLCTETGPFWFVTPKTT